DDDDDDDDCYARSVDIDIPSVPADVYNISHVAISIRDLLTFVAELDKENAERLLALRDAYYGGDDIFDYVAGAYENINATMTPEERAVARFERAKGREQREAARAALDPIGPVPDRFAHWKPFNAERRALEAEREALDE